MKSPTLLFAILTLSAMLAGCGNSDTAPDASDKTNKICSTIRDTGLAKQCVVNNRNNTVGIVVDTDDEKARTLCADIAGKMKPATAGLSDKWKLQIFSPYRDDKPLAACFLL